jgi:hypothetical protein
LERTHARTMAGILPRQGGQSEIHAPIQFDQLSQRVDKVQTGVTLCRSTVRVAYEQ